MTDRNEGVNVKITADSQTLAPGLQQAASAVSSATDKMRSSFEGLHGHVGKVSGSMEALAAPITRLTGLFGVLASVVAGAAFKTGIDEAKKLTGEAGKLASTLGITTTEASALNTALGDIGTDSDTYLGSLRMLERQLRSDEEGLQELGIATRDGKGHLLDARDVMTSALKEMGNYKQGLDQNTFAMRVFGRGAEEARVLMKLNAGVMEEARKKNEELGLSITQNNVTATKQYKAAMNDLGDVMSAIRKTIGDAVMPVFTDLANWFSSIGPAAVTVFRTAIQSVVVVMRLFQGAVLIIYDVFKGAFVQMIDLVANLGRTMMHVLKWEWSEAWEAAKKTVSDYRRNLSATWDEMVADATAVNDKIAAAVSPDTSGGATVGKSGNKTMGDLRSKKEQGDKSRMGQWEAELNEQKLALTKRNVEQQRFDEFSVAQEAAFWQAKLKIASLSAAERQGILSKWLGAATHMQRDAFEAEVALEHERAELAGNNATLRRESAEREAALVRTRFAETSDKVIEADRRVTAAKRAELAQRHQLDLISVKSAEANVLQQIDMEQAQYQRMAEVMGLSREEMLTIERAFEDRRREIKRQAAQAKVDTIDPTTDPVAYAQAKEELLQIEREFQRRMAEIKGKVDTQAMQPVVNAYRGIEQQLSSTLTNILTRTQSFGGAMRSLFQGIGKVMIDELVTKPLAAYLVGMIKRLVMAKSEIAANATVAASGAAASAAETPVVGWMMAVPAMLSTLGAVMGLSSSLPSAAKGYDIPSGVNPLTQLHQREMVLPSQYADVIRGLGDSGGAAAGDVHLHLSTPDADGARRFLLGNRAALADALRAAMRDGMLTR